jgi:hypothetical protein
VTQALGALLLLGALLMPAAASAAPTYTGSPLNLCLPTDDDYDWGTCWRNTMTVINSSWTIMDAAIAAVSTQTIAVDTTTLGTRLTAAEISLSTNMPVLEALRVSASTNNPVIEANRISLSTNTPRIAAHDAWMSTASVALEALRTTTETFRAWQSTASPRIAAFDAFLSTHAAWTPTRASTGTNADITRLDALAVIGTSPTIVGSVTAPTGSFALVNASTISASGAFRLYTNGGNLLFFCNTSGECVFGNATNVTENLDVTSTAGAYLALRRDDTTVSAGNDFGGITWRSEDSSTGGAGTKVAIEAEATTTYGSGDTDHNAAMYIRISSAASLSAFESETYATFTSTGLRGERNMAVDFSTITARDYFSVASSFTVSGSTLVVNRNPCAGVDCVVASSHSNVGWDRISFAGLENSSTTYRLRLRGEVRDFTAGTGPRIHYSVNNSSNNNAGYEYAGHAAASDTNYVDSDGTVGLSTACAMYSPTINQPENDPAGSFNADIIITLNGKKMTSHGTVRYRANGDNITAFTNFACDFNTAKAPMDLGPITSIQVFSSNGGGFAGKVTLIKESD